MSVIEVKSAVKKWGKNTVPIGVNLSAESSQIVGIIGHIGSGKTVLRTFKPSAACENSR